MVTYAITSTILVLGYTWAHKHVIKMLCQIIKHLDSRSRHSPGLKIWRMTTRGLNFNFKIHKASLSQETFITRGLTFCLLYCYLLHQLCYEIWPHQLQKSSSHSIKQTQITWKVLTSMGWIIVLQLSGSHISKILLIKDILIRKITYIFWKEISKAKLHCAEVTYRNKWIWKSQIQQIEGPITWHQITLLKRMLLLWKCVLNNIIMFRL